MIQFPLLDPVDHDWSAGSFLYIDVIKLKVMSTLKFTDGEVFDLSGPLRLEERFDGWYVVGNNKLIPVRSEAEGILYIQSH